MWQYTADFARKEVEWKQELWDLQQTTSFPIYTLNIVSIENIDQLLQINKTVWLAYIFLPSFQLVLNLKTKQHEAGKRKKILTFIFLKDEGFLSLFFVLYMYFYKKKKRYPPVEFKTLNKYKGCLFQSNCSRLLSQLCSWELRYQEGVVCAPVAQVLWSRVGRASLASMLYLSRHLCKTVVS